MRSKRKSAFKAIQKVKDYYLFSCPEILNIYNVEHIEKSIRFVNSFDEIIRCGFKKVVISFAGCKAIRGAAIMLLYAKLESIFQQCDVEISIQRSLNVSVNKFIEMSGLAYLCQFRYSQNDISQFHGNLAILNGKTGEFRDEIIDFIREDIYNNELSDEEEYLFSDAIQEAINNVYRHAYPEDTPQDERPWWWMCSVLGEQLYLMLYDLGQGIPATFVRGNEYFDQIEWDSEESQVVLQNLKTQLNLPEKLNLSDLEKQSKAVTDSMMIALAMSDDVTQMTGEKELKHGQGSKSIRKLVSDNEEGYLFICSNRGIFMYSDEYTRPSFYDIKTPIKGTLVQWNIRIKGKK